MRYACHYCNRITPVDVTCCEADAYDSAEAFASSLTNDLPTLPTHNTTT